MMPKSRRSIARALSLWSLAATALLGSLGASAQEEEKVLNVYNWSDYIADDTLKTFEKETGIKVRYDNYDTNEILHAKLVAGHSGYDIVVPSAHFARQQIEGGLFRKLDRAQLTHWGNLDPALLAQLAKVDPGNQYLVDWLWGYITVGINRPKVEKALAGLPMPENPWSLLFDPAVVSKLKDCGVYMLDSPQTVYPVALAYLGKNPNSKSPEDITAVEAMLAKVRPYIGNFKSTGYPSDLAVGEACVVMGWSGDIARADAEVAKAGNGIKLDYVVPKEGSTIWVDTFVVPKDAPNPDAAHKLIDFLTRADVAAQNSNYLRYPNGNKASFPLLDEAIRQDTRLYPPADTYTRLFMVEMFTDDALRNLTRSWTRVKAQQ